MLTIPGAVLLIIRLTLAAYVLPSGISKLRHQSEFLAAISNYKILSPQASAIVGAVLPWIEIVLGIAFLMGFVPPLTGICLIMLLIALIAAMGINIRRGRMIECGCYGVSSTKTIGWGAIARNLMLTGLALIQVSFSESGASYWITGSGWHIDATVLAFPDVLLVPILAGFCVIFISLVEWSIHMMSAAALMRGIRFE